MDPKLIELGVIPNLEIGQAAYNDYFRSAMLTQTNRLKRAICFSLALMCFECSFFSVGDDVEEAHMRNRQMICKWVLSKAKESGAVVKVRKRRTNVKLLNVFVGKVSKNGKTFFRVMDYEATRRHFGEMLCEVQRIKSTGDGAAGAKMVETFGVKVDQDLHKEVLDRFSKLNVRPYTGMLNPRLVPEMKGDEVVDVKIEYPKDFVEQHLEYSRKYSLKK